MVTFSSRKMPGASQVRALYRNARWARGRSLAKIEKMLQHSDLVFTCWDGKKLVGFARVQTDFTFRAVLFDVIVEPAHHRQGLGTRLVNQVLSHPRLAQVDQFWLYTTDKQDFYKRFGFQKYPDNVLILKKNPS